MKIAAYFSTLFVRLLGLYLLLSSAANLFMLTAVAFTGPIVERQAIVLTIKAGLGFAAMLMAGRLVRFFTADAPLGNE